MNELIAGCAACTTADEYGAASDGSPAGHSPVVAHVGVRNRGLPWFIHRHTERNP